MTLRHRLLSVLACCVLQVTFGAHAADDAVLAQLAWLGGCWHADGSEPGSGEQWMPLAGGSLLGMSRTVRQGRTAGHEFMRIAQGADGKLAFFAQPSGKPPASFPLRSLSGSEVVFENLDHEFPQRVIYRLAAPTQLRASIEGMRNGTLKTIDYPMTRVSCDAPLRPTDNATKE